MKEFLHKLNPEQTAQIVRLKREVIKLKSQIEVLKHKLEDYKERTRELCVGPQ